MVSLANVAYASFLVEAFQLGIDFLESVRYTIVSTIVGFIRYSLFKNSKIKTLDDIYGIKNSESYLIQEILNHQI